MFSRKTINIAAFALIALALVVGYIVLPSGLTVPQASALAPEDVMRLTGKVRDFRKSHVDFAVTPASGYGHYAGNVALTSNNRRPGFVGGGAKVSSQWHDIDNQPIAPHMFMAGGLVNANVIPVAAHSDTPSHGVLDSWDSSLGPYGGPNVGPEPEFLITSDLPTVTVPNELSMLSNQGDVDINKGSISADMRCDTLTVRNKLTISGNVSILCESDFYVHTNASVELNPGATLKVFLLNGGSSWNHVEINANTGDPSRVTIYNLGSAEFMIHNLAKVFAAIISPNAQLSITNHSDLYGSFIGKKMYFENHGSFHLDRSVNIPFDVCGSLLADTEGTWGAPDAGGIDSSSTFDQWFTDMIGTNLSLPHTITLIHEAGGIYRYTDTAFYPIDDRLFGNEGDAHNFCFTYAIDTQFTYSSCDDQFVEFSGSDDIWMFVNGQLVIDLGGILANTTQRIEMDRLGLTDGQEYGVQIFFAQRNTMSSTFNMRTNIDLNNTPRATYTGGYD